MRWRHLMLPLDFVTELLLIARLVSFTEQQVLKERRTGNP